MSRNRQQPQWEKSASRRRWVLLLLISSTTMIATGYMAYVLPQQGRILLEFMLLVFFAMLFAWISIGFWTALSGFILLIRRSDRWKIAPMPHVPIHDRKPLPFTAVLMPVYNENTQGVFNGLDAVYNSLAATGKLDFFHFFILSDTDEPDIFLQEEIAWYQMCRRLKGFGRIFYRHRSPNIKRKSGNVADFCRRWGSGYTYMIVLDADSVMTGHVMVQLVRLMEQHPDIGILQTTPLLAGQSSLLGRIQQFSNHMYGPMFAAGLHFWQLGDAQYWGHNAIIRISPFMRYCALPRLPGKPPLGGDILSHDFVEAAVMRRAGWGVWLAYDIEGSYEEPPATLINELVRDRRWCQGNMQHLRLLLTRGLPPAHRFLFLNGAMSYISAMLWFCFLCISTVEALSMILLTPDYFPSERSLFPNWPVWDPSWLLILLASTMVILFMPKVLGFILTLIWQRNSRAFGGMLQAGLSTFGEIFFSALLAPIRMLTHSKFVAATLLGGRIGWNPPNRYSQGTSWKAAIRFHGFGTLLALIWGIIVFSINRGFFWWISPVIIPLVLAVPLSVFVSKASIGQFLQRRGLFVSPPEIMPSDDQSGTTGMLGNRKKTPAATNDADGFSKTVVDPFLFGIHMLALRGKRTVSDAVAQKRSALTHRALHQGPGSLSRRERMQLLNDPDSLLALHEKVWELSDTEQARRWGLS